MYPEINIKSVGNSLYHLEQHLDVARSGNNLVEMLLPYLAWVLPTNGPIGQIESCSYVEGFVLWRERAVTVNQLKFEYLSTSH